MCISNNLPCVMHGTHHDEVQHVMFSSVHGTLLDKIGSLAFVTHAGGLVAHSCRGYGVRHEFLMIRKNLEVFALPLVIVVSGNL